MDIGAFVQSLAGQPLTPKGGGLSDDVNVTGSHQGSGNLAAGHETPSFIQAVRQLLDQPDNPEDVPDTDSHAAQYPSDDFSQLMLLMQMLLKEDGAALQGVKDTDPSLASAASESELTALLTEQLWELETTLRSVSDNTQEDQTSLLTLLNKRISALEASIDETTPALDNETRKDIEETLSLIKTELSSRLDQALTDPLQGTSDMLTRTPEIHIPASEGRAFLGSDFKSGTIAGDMQAIDIDEQAIDITAAKPQHQLVGTTADGMVARPADALLDTDPSVQQPAIVDDTKQHATALDGTNFTAKTAAQPLAVENNAATAHHKDPEQQPFEQQGEKLQTLQERGTKKQPSIGPSTITSQTQPASSLTEQEKGLLANERQALPDTQQGPALEADPAKPIPMDSDKTDILMDEPIDVSMSRNTPVDNKPSPTTANQTHFMPAAHDTGFQKRVMDQIVERAALRSVNDRSEVRIQLKPDALGDVRMSIVSEKNHLVVQMIADKSETKDIIESQIHHLKTELDKQGLTVNRIEVMISADTNQQDSRGQFFQMFKNHSEDNGKRQNGAHQEASRQDQRNDEKADDASSDGINYFV
jgi:flagellar hook-length control protein FliK